MRVHNEIANFTPISVIRDVKKRFGVISCSYLY